MSVTEMLALMYHRSEGRYGREQWLRDDDNWIINVVCRPSTAEADKPYWPVPSVDRTQPPRPPAKLMPFEELFYFIWRKRGMKDADIATKLEAEHPQAMKVKGRG